MKVAETRLAEQKNRDNTSRKEEEIARISEEMTHAKSVKK